MDTQRLKDLQQVALLSAILMEGKNERQLNFTEHELVQKLTGLGYIIPDGTPKGFVGQARRKKPLTKS